MLAPLAASGVALYALPYFIPRMVAKKYDPDAVSTIKIGAALLVYPLWMGGLVAGSLVLFAYFGGRRGRALYGLEPAAPQAGGETPP